MDTVWIGILSPATLHGLFILLAVHLSRKPEKCKGIGDRSGNLNSVGGNVSDSRSESHTAARHPRGTGGGCGSGDQSYCHLALGIYTLEAGAFANGQAATGHSNGGYAAGDGHGC
ncbi:hypothetical protein ACOSQ2_029711 [Xanthoceras sorbifolium]